jgi:hypothetical protein
LRRQRGQPVGWHSSPVRIPGQRIAAAMMNMESRLQEAAQITAAGQTQ